jgi:hypothetical protein
MHQQHDFFILVLEIATRKCPFASKQQQLYSKRGKNVKPFPGDQRAPFKVLYKSKCKNKKSIEEIEQKVNFSLNSII